MRAPLAVLALTAILVATALGAEFLAPSALEDLRTASADAEFADAIGSAATVDHVFVESFDGTRIAVTVFKPEGATPSEPVPVILHGHGWSGTRARVATGLVRDLLETGYGVISIDARGHGESGGVATVMHRDVEVRDYQAILDHAWEIPWILKDEGSGGPFAKDVVAGAIGGSYGGGYQLTLASHDGRLDALVPDMTWNDLRYSLVPHAAVKTFWPATLVALAKSSGTRVHEDVDAWLVEAAVTGRMPATAAAHFAGSNPEPRAIRAHVLLTQGVPDTLFNVNEALATYAGLGDAAAAGYDVRLLTHLGGHVTPYAGAHLGNPQGILTSPCGDRNAVTVAWFDRHLKGLDRELPAHVSWALEDGSCIERDAPGPDHVLEARAPAPVTVPRGGGSILVHLLDASEDLVVAGVPNLTARAIGLGDTVLHASLVVLGETGPRVVNHQVAGLRFNPSAEGTLITFDLNAVATRLLAGERLMLRLDGANEQSFAGGSRVPGAVVLEGIVVGVPVLEA